jgi:hypothetical protein
VEGVGNEGTSKQTKKRKGKSLVLPIQHTSTSSFFWEIRDVKADKKTEKEIC